MPEFTVYVDSDNRNRILYPNSNSFVLHLTNPILNIVKAELVSAMVPGLAVSEFLCLDIEELRTPTHLVADALRRGNDGKMVPTSNAMDGSFAIVPMKVSGTFDFYNQNYSLSTEYPAHIPKLDRLTVKWRQPNSGDLYYETADMGRTMFLLRFETAEQRAVEGPSGLPDPVEWDSGERHRLILLTAVALAGLLVIVTIRK
jgi:hypothetical protein